MKSIYSIVLAMLFCSVAFGQQKMVIIEEFTNASCPPCAAQNPGFDALLENNHDKVIALRYHTSFPGFDPMNQHNPDEVSLRRLYYGINGVPTTAIGGFIPPQSYAGGAGTFSSFWPGAPGGFNQPVLDFAYNELSSDLSVVVDADYNLSNDSVLVTIQITNNDTVDYAGASDVLHVVLAEEEINFESPPGSTAEQDFHMVVKKMFPNQLGTAMMDIAAGETYTHSVAIPSPNFYYDKNKLNCVSFIQNEASKTILQGGISELATFNGIQIDVEASSDASTKLICGQTELSPILTVTNVGDTMATDFVISVADVNGVIDFLTYTDTLLPGETANIPFTNAVPVGYGETPYGYFLQSNQDIGVVNNSLIVYTYSVGDFSSDYDLEFTFEGLGINDLPTDHFVFDNSEGNRIFVIDRANFQTPPTNPLGGFLQSEDVMFFNVYSIPAGNSNTIYFDKMNLTDYNEASFKFSLAYAQFGAENDRLEVDVTTDCGATWNSLFDEAGSSLATRAPFNQGNFYPQAVAEWDSISLDLIDYVGMDDIVIRMKVTSDFGNNLFLDDIRVTKDFNSAVGELEAISEFEISPNPVQDVLNINLSLTSNVSSASVSIIDISGSHVMNVFEGSLTTQNNFRANVSDLASGMYFIQVKSDEGVSNRKFVVN